MSDIDTGCTHRKWIKHQGLCPLCLKHDADYYRRQVEELKGPFVSRDKAVEENARLRASLEELQTEAWLRGKPQKNDGRNLVMVWLLSAVPWVIVVVLYWLG